jgi:MoxR-like ATPase
LDRFLIKILVPYPALPDERSILERHHFSVEPKDLELTPLTPVSPTLLAAARREIRAVRIEPALFDYLLAIIRRTRDWPTITLGASPRASTSLMLVAKAYAARDGRDFLIPDDIKIAATPVLRHRLVLRPEAELEGFDTDRVINDILTATALPK